MEEHTPKEVDLIALLNSVGRSISNLIVNVYHAMWWLVAFAIKNYIPLVIFLMVGVGIGIFNISTADKGYQSFMTIRTNAVRSYEMKAYFDEMSTYFKHKDKVTYPILEQKFNLDSATLSKVAVLKSHFFIDYWNNGTMDEIDLKDKHSTKDTLNVRDSLHLCIEAIVSEPAVFSKLGSAIETFLNKQPYLINANANRLTRLNEDIALYNTELGYLDSLQRVSYFNNSNSMAQLQFDARSGFVLGENRQQLYHYEKYWMQAKKKIRLNEVDLYSDIITIENDFPIVTTELQSNYYILVKSGILFSIMGYFILLLIYFFKKNYKMYIDKI